MNSTALEGGQHGYDVMEGRVGTVERLKEVCEGKGIEVIYIKNVRQVPSIIFNKNDKIVLICCNATDLDINNFKSTYLT